MKYIKIKGYGLSTVLGRAALNMKSMNSIGVMFLGKHQMNDSDENQIQKISYGLITDESKFEINHPGIVVFNTIEEVNSDIDNEYTEIFTLKDIQEVTLDLQLSGNVTPDGYDPAQTLDSQHNLSVLFNANMGGIVKNKKAEYFK